MSLYRGFHWGSTCIERIKQLEDDLNNEYKLLREARANIADEAQRNRVLTKRVKELEGERTALATENEQLSSKIVTANQAITQLTVELKEQKAILGYTMHEKDQKIKVLESEITELNNTIVYSKKTKKRKKRKPAEEEDSIWGPYVNQAYVTKKKTEKKKPGRRPKIAQYTTKG